MPKLSSLQNRLRAVILLTCTIVLTLTTAAFVIYEIFNFREQQLRDLSTLATVIADNSAAPLVFDSSLNAQDILSTMREAPEIQCAILYDRQGSIFACYPSALPRQFVPSLPLKPGHKFTINSLIIVKPIIQNKKIVGALYISSSLHNFYQRFWLYLLIVGTVLAASLALTFLISTRLQRRISEPILTLTDAARVIAEKEDYSVRVPLLHDDELGVLTSVFNKMTAETETHQRKLNEELAERTKAQTELHEARNNLEEIVQQRTAELRASIGELESLSYSIAHDMRAPLRAIQNFTNILLDESGDKVGQSGRDYLARVMNAALRMDRLIQDVLSFSRISRQSIEVRYLDVERLIRQIIHDRMDLQRPNAIIRIESPLLPVFGHEPSLFQCLTNILGNAVKFVPQKKKPRIRIWTEMINPDAPADGNLPALPRVRLWIEDNGIGIPESTHERIFGLFERNHSENEYEGTGVGLAIVRKAAERMGGTVGVESELGVGSRFWLELRAAKSSRSLDNAARSEHARTSESLLSRT